MGHDRGLDCGYDRDASPERPPERPDWLLMAVPATTHYPTPPSWPAARLWTVGARPRWLFAYSIDQGFRRQSQPNSSTRSLWAPAPGKAIILVTQNSSLRIAGSHPLCGPQPWLAD